MPPTKMQTPLAIINSRLDLLIQDQELGVEHHRHIQAMYDAIGRLRQLNQSLLAADQDREPSEFDHTEPVDMAPLIEEKLVQLEDPLRLRRLVAPGPSTGFASPINGYLADILLNNLLLERHPSQPGVAEN